MKFRRAAGWLLVAQLFCGWPALAQDTYKSQAIGAPDPADLPKTLHDALEPAGARVLDSQGAAFCEVWLRNPVPTAGSGAASGDTIYPGLSLGTFVGVLRFPKGGSDFRGQPIKAGFYTLRYALVPQDGNHLGVSAYRDFLLLGPAAQDTEVDKALIFDEMVKLSRQASGTGHPAVLSLAPVAGAREAPAVSKDDEGHWILQVKVRGKSAGGEQNFPMGIVLVGKSEAG